MQQPHGTPRVILVILDGLRPDAITPHVMPVLSAVADRGWSAVAHTVRPSVTVAALASLATGVSPARHGLDADRKLPAPAVLRRLAPLPAHLQRHRRRTAICTGRLPLYHRLLAGSLLRVAGATSFCSAGRLPAEIGERARDFLQRLRPHLGVVYLNDCDVAGHRDGWMSPSYLEAAHALDGAVGALVSLEEEVGTTLLVTADHGGGGVAPTDHDAPHPVNDRIPIIAAGSSIPHHVAEDGSASLLDLPPTILDLLGVPVPPQYEGRALDLSAERSAVAA
jgi:predicted AlkP superfamily pyrophosphatase or phosphodiesterase